MRHRALILVFAASATLGACSGAETSDAAAFAERSRAAREARLANFPAGDSAGSVVADTPPASHDEQPGDDTAYVRPSPLDARQSDSLGMLIASLESMTQPFVGVRDSVMQSIAADSGTARADSSLLRLRSLGKGTLTEMAQELDEPGWQAVMIPDGFVAERRRAASGLNPSSVDSASRFMADSIARFLRSRGVLARSEEGHTYCYVDDAALLERSGGFLTPAMHSYLAMVAVEQTARMAADGSLMTAMENVAARMLATDRLLADHPRFAGAPQAEELLKRYMHVFLAGGGESAGFDRKSRLLDPKARQRYEQYAAANGSTRTGAAVRDYLALLKMAGYRDGPATKKFRERFELMNRQGFTTGVIAARLPLTESPEYVEPDACAGELCMKIEGMQTSYDTLVLHERADSTSRVLARLAPPAQVMVLGMELHSRPAPLVVRREHAGYLPGDTLWILNDHGEDYYTLRRGTLAPVHMRLVYGAHAKPVYPLCVQPYCWAEQVAPLRIASWFRFRTGSGIEGWALPRSMDGGTGAPMR